VKNQTEAKVAT